MKTAPNATAFLQMNGCTVQAACGCLLEPEADGAALYQCETHETAENTKRTLSAALDAMDELAEFLKETHGSEIEDGHGGDGPDGCTYCAAIIQADAVKREALNLCTARGSGLLLMRH